MKIDVAAVRKYFAIPSLQNVFTSKEAGPVKTSLSPILRNSAHNDIGFTRRQVAQLSGVVVFEVAADNGQSQTLRHAQSSTGKYSSLHHENLLIFVDKYRTQSLWYWVKRQDGKTFTRDHIYVKGQPGDLFLSKLNSMVFEMSDFDESGAVPLVEVADR